MLDQQQQGNISTREFRSPAQPEGVIKWRMDTKEPLRDWEIQLMGLLWDNKLKQYVKPKQSMAFCNEYGISYARTFLSGLLNKNTLQGNISEDILRDQMIYLGDAVCKDVGIEWRRMGVPKNRRDVFVGLILEQAFIALTRPINDQERVHTVNQGRESITTNQHISDMLPGLGQMQQNFRPGLL